MKELQICKPKIIKIQNDNKIKRKLNKPLCKLIGVPNVRIKYNPNIMRRNTKCKHNNNNINKKI